jgi:hypothetical protein
MKAKEATKATIDDLQAELLKKTIEAKTKEIKVCHACGQRVNHLPKKKLFEER